MHESATGSGEFSRVSEPALIAADSAPVVLYRTRVGQFDVELWDEEDGLVIDRDSGDRHRCVWSVESNDEHCVVDFHCRSLGRAENRRIIRALVDATVTYPDGTVLRVDTCRAI